MKKIIAVLAAIILFTSCGTPESAESITTPTTTTAATFEMTTTAETTITEKAIETEFQPIIVYSELNIADFESVSAKSEEEYYYDYDISFIDGKADFDYSNLIEVEKYNELFIYSDDKNLNDIVANDSIEILNVCQTSTADLKGIENFNSLKVFNFYMYNVNIKDISDIKKSPAIERVHLNYADSVEDFSPLGELKNLKYLSITSQTLPGIEAISNCKELEFLYLYNFKELDPSFISELPHLKNLILSKKISYIEDISFLENLSQLERLEITCSKDSDLSVLANLKSLKELKINNPEITDEQKNILREKMPWCEII